jgi:hypothetical protein
MAALEDRITERWLRRRFVLVWYPRQEGGETVSDPNDLGAVVREFRPGRWGTSLVVSSLALALSLGIMFLLKPHDKPLEGPAVAIAFVVLPCLITFQVCLLQWGFSLGHRIVLHEHGLVARTPGKTQQVRWEDVGAVYHHMFNPSRLDAGQETWIVTRGGEKVQLPRRVAGLFAAYREICDRVQARLLQELRQKISASQTVAFGDDLRVSRGGLEWRDRLLPLADVKKLLWGVEYDPAKRSRWAVRSFLGVLDPAGYERLPTKSLPNLPVLLELLESDHHVAVERETSLFR